MKNMKTLNPKFRSEWHDHPFCEREFCLLMMMIVYWYSFSNHYTRECIHTCERERTCGSSQSSPGFMLAPSSWCRHALHARHPPSPPCLVSSQTGFGMQCYSSLHARWPQCVYRGRVQADPVYLWSSLHAPPRLHRQLIYTYGFSPHNQDHTQCYYCTSSAYEVKSTEC